MKISKIDVTRPEGSFYQMVITGEGFGDRRGKVNVWMPDEPDFHVDPVEWTDTAITVMVSDSDMGVPGLHPGSGMVEVIPVPGMVMEFKVADPKARRVPKTD